MDLNIFIAHFGYIAAFFGLGVVAGWLTYEKTAGLRKKFFKKK